MAKSTITNITTSQTFQNWFDKTNEVVDLFKNETLTASAGAGDTTNGNSTLVGDFTATNLTATTAIKTNDIAPRTSGADIDFSAPVIVTAATSQLCATFSYTSGGGRTRYTDGTTSWDMGLEDSTDRNFIIDTGVGDTKFQLSTGGTLTVSDIIVSDAVDITGDLDVGGDMRVTGTANFDGNVDLTDGDLTLDNLFATGDVVTNYSSSDFKLKENIERIENPLEKVAAIGGYTFNYKDTPDEMATGVIAQEIEQILPGLVFDTNHPTRGEHKAVRYGNIVALLIEAIKELNDEVNKLKHGTSD